MVDAVDVRFGAADRSGTPDQGAPFTDQTEREWHEADADAPGDHITIDGDVVFRADPASDLRPLIVVDGVIMSPGTEPSDLDALDIDSVEVIKGEAARSLYGERARHGVIRIKTKSGG